MDTNPNRLRILILNRNPSRVNRFPGLRTHSHRNQGPPLETGAEKDEKRDEVLSSKSGKAAF